LKVVEFVSKYDPSNQFKVLRESYKQIEYAWNNKFDISSLKEKTFETILVSGLGGSAISADLLQNFLYNEIKIPYFVNRNYFLPPFINQNSLVIISSYSGNTEETYSVLGSAIKKGCNIVCITTGGKIEKLAKENKIPIIKITPGLQPRYALGLSFFSLLKLFQELQFVGNHDPIVNKIIQLWNKKADEYSAEDNIAFNYAKEIIGHIPVIYSTADKTSAVGYRMKCQFNENAKLHAFHNVIPEMNHNEIIGWESFLEKQFNTMVINILDPDYFLQIRKRFQITTELIEGSKAPVINLESSEKEFKVRLLDLIYLIDWITYYTAVLRGFDPVEIKNINSLKEKLA